MTEQQSIQHIPPVPHYIIPAHEAAQNRLDYLEEVKLAFSQALQTAADKAPWTITRAEIKTAQLYMKDVVDDLFYRVAEEDRDIVETNDINEAREQSGHESFERERVRGF